MLDGLTRYLSKQPGELSSTASSNGIVELTYRRHR